MILIIMRHGEAVEYRHPDHTRSLTDYGKEQCSKMGETLEAFLIDKAQHNTPEIQNVVNEITRGAAQEARNPPVIDLALVSPYLRTQQSCQALTKNLEVTKQVTTDAITPMGNAGQCADLIHGYASDIYKPEVMLVVTHMPLVSLLADNICSEFNAKIFEPADTLIIDYNTETGVGGQLAFYQASR